MTSDGVSGISPATAVARAKRSAIIRSSYGAHGRRVAAADRLLRRRRVPQREPAQHPVVRDALAEKLLVFPLDLGHRQQAVDHLLMPTLTRVDGGVLILDDVVPLELPGPVDRSEPAADVAERSDRLADAVEDRL